MVFTSGDVRALVASFEAAVREHALRAGGVMVGDTISFSGFEVDVLRIEGGQLQFGWAEEKP
jgi:hypothetical protein